MNIFNDTRSLEIHSPNSHKDQGAKILILQTEKSNIASLCLQIKKSTDSESLNQESGKLGLQSELCILGERVSEWMRV